MKKNKDEVIEFCVGVFETLKIFPAYKNLCDFTEDEKEILTKNEEILNSMIIVNYLLVSKEKYNIKLSYDEIIDILISTIELKSNHDVKNKFNEYINKIKLDKFDSKTIKNKLINIISDNFFNNTDILFITKMSLYITRLFKMFDTCFLNLNNTISDLSIEKSVEQLKNIEKEMLNNKRMKATTNVKETFKIAPDYDVEITIKNKDTIITSNNFDNIIYYSIHKDNLEAIHLCSLDTFFEIFNKIHQSYLSFFSYLDKPIEIESLTKLINLTENQILKYKERLEELTNEK